MDFPGYRQRSAGRIGPETAGDDARTDQCYGIRSWFSRDRPADRVHGLRRGGGNLRVEGTTMESTVSVTLVRWDNPATGECWVVCFDSSRIGDALRAIGRWAADPSCNFTWMNAAQMAMKIRQHEEGL